MATIGPADAAGPADAGGRAGGEPAAATPGPFPPWPGLAVVAVLMGAAWLVAEALGTVSALVVAVVLGAALANMVGVPDRLAPGFTFAGRRLLRLGVVLLGLRLSVGDMASLGLDGLVVVALTVAATFFGTLWLGRRLGLSGDLSLLVATGYSICGASAIAAMEGTTDAEEEEVAAAIGLVTLFGSLSILTLPVVGAVLGLDDAAFGSWVGASTHDVAQVVAAASTGGAAAVSAAVVVKLTRVALLAPLVAGVSLHRRLGARSDHGPADRSGDAARPPLLPLFVVGFLAAVALRSTGLLGDGAIDAVRTFEGLLLTAAMVGLGTGVRVDRLRHLGLRPLVLGVAAWVVVAGVAYLGVALVLG